MFRVCSVFTTIIGNRRWGVKLSASLLLLVWASTVVAAPDYTRQRELFRVADAALAAGERDALNGARTALRDYPLYPYLAYRDLHQRLGEFPATEIQAFIRDYADLPLAERLRIQWLHHLAHNQRWDQFLRDYQPSDNVTLDCLYRRALLSQGHTSAALEGIESVWVYGHSRPPACDPVFAVWRERGGFTQERIWQRFGLAMAAGQDGLARYLYNLLQGERRTVAERWLAIHADPGRIRRLDADQPYAADLALHGLRVLVRRDSVATAPLFDQLQARYRRASDPEWNALQRQLAVFVAARGHPGAAERLAAIPEPWVDESVEAWRIRVALRAQDWPEVLRQTERLSATSAQQLRWRYWRARALEALGEPGAARALYTELASQRDYYGFLAADRLQQPYTITHHPSAVPQNWMATSAGSALLRIRELTYLERDVDARREWRHLLNNGSPQALRTAAVLADRWGWHRQAVVALVRADEWDDLTLRFPLPYREQVVSAAQTQGIDPAWIYAVMRQESLFQEDARSSANALGLMQILPTTGQRIARERGETWAGERRLLHPPTNIQYGAHYLRGNLQRLQTNPVLASAAYNAGASRVRSWLPEHEPMDADIWAETIPFFETRRYIRRIMEYYVVYGWRLGGAPPALHALMPPVRPSNHTQ